MLNKDSRYFTLNKLLRTVVLIFIDTFFSVYFFTLCNYEILPMAKYYLIEYISLPLGFFIIRKAIKKNIKLPYYRISFSLLGIYLSLILLLKAKIINYILLLGFFKGLGDGFYYYPTNIFDAEKISNSDRNKYSGLLNTVNTLISIIIPLGLGFLLSKMSYINAGKIFMIVIILMFGLSFKMSDPNVSQKEFNLKKFFDYLKNDSSLKEMFKIRYLEGLTYSSSALNVVITLYSILYLKTNLNIGILTSVLSCISLVTTTLYAYKNSKNDRLLINLSLIFILSSLGLIFIRPNIYTLIIFLIINNSLIVYIDLLDKNMFTNLTNQYTMIRNNYKAEYHLLLEIFINSGRITGFLLFFAIGLIGQITYFKIIIGLSIIAYLILLIKIKKIHE